MDLDKIVERSGVSRRQIRKVVEALRHYHYLPPGDKITAVVEAKSNLAKGQWLSVPQLVEMIEKPDLIKALGTKAPAARAQIAALHDPSREIDKDMSGAIPDTAARSETAAARLEEWIKATVPQHGDCSYHYLGVRLLLMAQPSMRNSVATRMKYAFMLIRARPSFDGWFTVEQRGSRRQTRYHRPKGEK